MTAAARLIASSPDRAARIAAGTAPAMSVAVTGDGDRSLAARAAVQPDRGSRRLVRAAPSRQPSDHADASTAATTPVSTSPEPAVPRSAVPSVSTKPIPSGSTISVPGPLRTTIACSDEAAARAASSRPRSASAPGRSRSNSPSCGVRTVGRPRSARSTIVVPGCPPSPRRRRGHRRRGPPAHVRLENRPDGRLVGIVADEARAAGPAGDACLLGGRLAVDHDVREAAHDDPGVAVGAVEVAHHPHVRGPRRAGDEQGGSRVRPRSGGHPHHPAAVLVGVLGRLGHPARPRRPPPGRMRRARREVEPDVDELDGAGVEAPRRDEQSGLQRPEGHRQVGGDRDARHDTGVGIDTARQVDRDHDRVGLVDGAHQSDGVGPQPASAADAEDPVDDEVRRMDQRDDRRIVLLPPVQSPAGPCAGRAHPPRGPGRTGRRHRRGTREPRAWRPPRARRRRCCPSRRAGRPASRDATRASASTPAQAIDRAVGRPLHQGPVRDDPERLVLGRAHLGDLCAGGSCDARRARRDDEGDGHVTIMAERHQP